MFGSDTPSGPVYANPPGYNGYLEMLELDPDIVEGHNIFKFDLDYLRQRSRRHRVPCAWGRFGMKAEFRNSRMKVAERWIDFSRCDTMCCLRERAADVIDARPDDTATGPLPPSAAAAVSA